jgi:hypothetical protein
MRTTYSQSQNEMLSAGMLVHTDHSVGGGMEKKGAWMTLCILNPQARNGRNP